MTQLFSIALENVAIAIPLALVVWGLTRVLKNPPVAHILWVAGAGEAGDTAAGAFRYPQLGLGPRAGRRQTHRCLARSASTTGRRPPAFHCPVVDNRPRRGRTNRAVDRRPGAAQHDAKRPLPLDYERRWRRPGAHLAPW